MAPSLLCFCNMHHASWRHLNLRLILGELYVLYYLFVILQFPFYLLYVLRRQGAHAYLSCRWVVQITGTRPRSEGLRGQLGS